MSGVEKQDLTLEAVKEVIEKAQKRGAEAAAAKYEKMCGKDRRRGGLRGLCGGGLIMINLDGRTRLARQLKLASQQIDQFCFHPRGNNGTNFVHIVGMHNRQEQEVDEAALEAALAVLKKELRVAGCVGRYYT